jgi:general secretion pathway protein N
LNRLATIAAVLVAVLGTVVAFAPAAWLADALERRTVLRLVYADGTVWRGSAQMAVSDGRQAVLLPGRLSWRVEWGALLDGRIVLQLTHATMDAPVEIGLDGQTLEIRKGAAQMPAALLVALGAPFNTARPGGDLRLQWENLVFRRDGFEGRLQLDWEDAQSALSLVAPLGSYRVSAVGRGARAEVQLTTLKGPLQVKGEGSMENGTIRFTGSAEADPEMRTALNGLIGLLGRRAGDRALLNWESRK